MNLVTLQNIGIIVLLVLSMPLFVTITLCFIKNKFSEKASIYMYAFSTGLLVILSTLGLIKEGFDELENISHSSQSFLFDNEIVNRIVVIGGGVCAGLIFSISIKIFIFKYKNMKLKKAKIKIEDHCSDKCCVVNFEETIKRHGAIATMLIVSSHRFIDGLSLGLLVGESNELFNFNYLGTIILFLIHDLPVVIIIFYMQRNSNVSKIKSVLYVFLLSLLTVPFIFIGAFFTENINNNPNVIWLMPFLESLVGSSLLFTTMMEFAPEFIHNHHLCTKHWYVTVLWLSIGIILAILLTTIHFH